MDRFKKKKTHSGVTLIEILVVVAILGVAIFLLKVVVNVVTGFAQNSASVQIQRDVQGVLYDINRDVRNCKTIVKASTDTIQMRMVNTRLGYSATVNPNLFDNVNLATMTYQYIDTGVDSYIKRTIQYPGLATDEKILLKNVLVKPVAPDYIFNGCDIGNTSAFLNQPLVPISPTGEYVNPRGVDVRLRVSPLFVKNSSKLYSARAMRRSN